MRRDSNPVPLLPLVRGEAVKIVIARYCITDIEKTEQLPGAQIGDVCRVEIEISRRERGSGYHHDICDCVVTEITETSVTLEVKQ